MLNNVSLLFHLFYVFKKKIVNNFVHKQTPRLSYFYKVDQSPKLIVDTTRRPIIHKTYFKI